MLRPDDAHRPGGRQRESDDRQGTAFQDPARHVSLIGPQRAARERREPAWRGRGPAQEAEEEDRWQEARGGCGAKRRACPEDQLAHRTLVDPEIARDLAAAPSVYRRAQKRVALGLWKSGKRCERLPRPGRLTGFVRGRPAAAQGFRELERPGAPVAETRQRLTVSDRKEPRSKRLDLGAGTNRPPRREERVLNSVLGCRRADDLRAVA